MTAPALPTLRTPRLTLRPLQETDADAIVAGVGNYDVSRWLGVVPYPYTRADAEGFLASVDPAKRFSWAIDAGDGLIGVMSVGERLGYWLARPAWRKGYGFEAAVGALTHWFEATDARQVGVGHFDGNDRSAQIISALGFKYCATGTTFAKSLQQEVTSHEYLLKRADWAARQSFRIEAERLVIRPLDDSDALDFSMLTVPEVTRMLSNLKTGMTEAEALADFPRRRWRGYLRFTLALEYQGRMVGTIGCGTGEVGFFLAPALWGKGLMTEAMGAVLPALFDKFPVSRIEAGHFEDNPASGRVLRKLGFEKTGRELAMSLARLEPAPLITYALERDKLRA